MCIRDRLKLPTEALLIKEVMRMREEVEDLKAHQTMIANLKNAMKQTEKDKAGLEEEVAKMGKALKQKEKTLSDLTKQVETLTNEREELKLSLIHI
eukprot:TRINITY_DN18478_c0_g1_i1.p1 TRINITY_DN18478_c0_g1~~TRINITY_DN18478_c0_g1_i1.p1  ORF type:complete len:112 (-),score=50.69 TRINITY_DN18478_c0_g1_i1:22-309(-)